MREEKLDPIRPTDEEARALTRDLFQNARFGALATLQASVPFVTRIALVPTDGSYLTLISDLAAHTKHLRADPRAALLIGEPGDKGDPLTHPRMTLEVTAEFLDKTEARIAEYLAVLPKAKLYIGFADFHLVRLRPQVVHLNGGFGKAYQPLPEDLKS